MTRPVVARAAYVVLRDLIGEIREAAAVGRP
jgi:hypothetical protein